MDAKYLADARSLSRAAFRNATIARHDAVAATPLYRDEAEANKPSRVGAHLTARQMALKPHNLSEDGMEAYAKDGGLWKWSTHFNVWACVSA